MNEMTLQKALHIVATMKSSDLLFGEVAQKLADEINKTNSEKNKENNL